MIGTKATSSDGGRDLGCASVHFPLVQFRPHRPHARLLANSPAARRSPRDLVPPGYYYNAERHSKPRPGVELCSTVENRHERLHIKNTRPLCAPMPSLRFGEAAFTRYDHLRGSELKMGQSVEPCRDSRQFRLAIVANICAQSRPAPAQRPSARHRRKVVL